MAAQQPSSAQLASHHPYPVLPAADVPSDALSRLTRLTTLTLTGAFVRDFGAGWETKLDCLRWVGGVLLVGRLFLMGSASLVSGVLLVGGVFLLFWLPQVGSVRLFVGLPQVGSLFLLAC